MAMYTLDEDQREIVETALSIYADELKKLLKNAVKNRVDTADIENKLEAIVGDDEAPGLLRIFAYDVSGQKDLFFDVQKGEEIEEASSDDGTEALVEEMYGAEEEAEEEGEEGPEPVQEDAEPKEHTFTGVVPVSDPYAPDKAEEKGGVPAYLRDVPVTDRYCLVCLDFFGPDGTCPNPDCSEVAPWAEQVAAE